MISGPWSTNFALAPSRCTAAKTLCVSMIYPLYSFEIILQPGVAYVAHYLAANCVVRSGERVKVSFLGEGAGVPAGELTIQRWFQKYLLQRSHLLKVGSMEQEQTARAPLDWLKLRHGGSVEHASLSLSKFPLRITRTNLLPRKEAPSRCSTRGALRTATPAPRT